MSTISRLGHSGQPTVQRDFLENPEPRNPKGRWVRNRFLERVLLLRGHNAAIIFNSVSGCDRCQRCGHSGGYDGDQQWEARRLGVAFGQLWFEADEALDCRGRARGVHVRV
jgi:hypothetical protein